MTVVSADVMHDHVARCVKARAGLTKDTDARGLWSLAGVGVQARDEGERLQPVSDNPNPNPNSTLPLSSGDHESERGKASTSTYAHELAVRCSNWTESLNILGERLRPRFDAQSVCHALIHPGVPAIASATAPEHKSAEQLARDASDALRASALVCAHSGGLLRVQEEQQARMELAQTRAAQEGQLKELLKGMMGASEQERQRAVRSVEDVFAAVTAIADDEAVLAAMPVANIFGAPV